MKPFLPLALPWQVPALQPTRDIVGITSRTKLTSYLSFCPVTLTGIVAAWPARVNLRTPSPSAAGRTSTLGLTFTLAGFSTSAMRVTSMRSPVSSTPVSTTWAYWKGVARAMLAGWASILTSLAPGGSVSLVSSARAAVQPRAAARTAAAVSVRPMILMMRRSPS